MDCAGLGWVGLEQGGVPVPHPHPQAPIHHEHLSAPGLRPPRDMRATATLVGGGMRPEPVEGGGWNARVVAGVGGAGEFDYADGFASHRGGYEIGGHPPPRHAVRERERETLDIQR